MKSTLWQTQPYKAAFYLQRSTALEFKWHHHDYWEIFASESGSGQIIAGDYHGRFMSGDVYVLCPGIPHAFFDLNAQGRTADADRYFVLTVDLEPMKQLAGLSTFRDFEKAGRSGLYFTGTDASDLLARIRRAHDGIGLCRCIRVLEVLEALMRAKGTPLTRLVYPEAPKIRDTDRIEKILRFLHEHYVEPIGISALAARCGMSEKTLSRVFKRSTGQTLVEYLNRLRVSSACRQLIQTNDPITEVAYDNGFNSLSNFNRMFLRYEGQTPSAVKKAASA